MDRQTSGQNMQGPKNRKKRNYNKNKKPRQTQQFKRRGEPQQLGYFGPMPTLHDLAQENRRRMLHRRFPNDQPPHFRDEATPTPRSVPPAPPPGSFPGVGLNPLATPALLDPAAAANAAVVPLEKLEADREGLRGDLDFYGTNEGLVFYKDGHEEHSSDGEGPSHSHSHSDDDSSEREGEHVKPHHSSGRRGTSGHEEVRPAGSDIQRRILKRLRDRVSQQDAYIVQLEDDALNMRERMDLALEELRKARNVATDGMASRGKYSMQHEVRYE